MLIYSHIITPRVEYAFRVIFGHVLGLPYQLTTNEQAFLASNNPKIAYCKDRRGDEDHEREKCCDTSNVHDEGVHTINLYRNLDSY